jgi:hypothetical protein
MNYKLKAAVIAVLAASLVGSNAYAGDPPPPAKKQTKAKKPPKPTVEEQINALRQEFQTQIDGLKSEMATKDAQLKQAQQTAADAQAAATKAQADATAQQRATTENAAAVSTLQASVTDMKTVNAAVVAGITDETAAIKKSISSPTVLHYKGVTLAPGGFLAAETVYRTKSTGGDIPTPFNALPYEHADAYSLSEFFGDARQSRISLMVEGKVNWGTLRGYYEADWLGTGATSNNNQSNSYVLRERVLWAQAETNSHWAFTGGQLWSLATEDKKGLSNLSGDIMTPQTIDPNYVVGFVWTRQWGFRVTKTYKKTAFGVALENPQILYTASLAGNTPYAVIGSQGANGGNFNPAVSNCSPATSVVNYTNQVQTDSAGNTIDVAVPVYKTVTSCANVANLSFNKAPDVIVKVAFDPKFGHYEILGIGRFAHETVYPGETTDSNLYGGLKDIATGLNVAPALTTAGSYANSVAMGGFGGSFRIPIGKKVIVGAKSLYGPGMGRYGNSTLSDVTTNAAGEFRALHNLSSLGTLEINPTPRLALYFNYGADYASRTDYANPGSTTLGAPTAQFCPKTAGAFACTATPTAADIAAGGTWGGHWATPALAAVGYGSRLLNNSSCNVASNPGFNGSSTGYYAGGSCGAQTRNVQEITGGYWYDIYRGEHGRLRQAIQYGYAVRNGWSGAAGIGAKGIDNMFWTSFRYYLP